MAMSFQDIQFMFSIGAYPRDEETKEPFRILTKEENAQVDELMQDLLGTNSLREKSDDDKT
jgi:hypothetical protein